MQQGPDFSGGVSGQDVGIDSSSHLLSRKLHYQLATINIFPPRPSAFLAREVMIHSLFFFQGAPS
jgi:hypothetical protein